VFCYLLLTSVNLADNTRNHDMIAGLGTCPLIHLHPNYYC